MLYGPFVQLTAQSCLKGRRINRKDSIMKHSSVLGFYVSLALTIMVALLASIVAQAGAPGKKCECGGGDARCFFDGSRCPVSGGKCACFKAPGITKDKQTLQLRSGRQATVAATEFCTATCPKSVGGEKCGAQCKLTKGHSGGHLCIKLHDF
jgi:hypothetical protein